MAAKVAAERYGDELVITKPQLLSVLQEAPRAQAVRLVCQHLCLKLAVAYTMRLGHLMRKVKCGQSA